MGSESSLFLLPKRQQKRRVRTLPLASEPFATECASALSPIAHGISGDPADQGYYIKKAARTGRPFENSLASDGKKIPLTSEKALGRDLLIHLPFYQKKRTIAHFQEVLQILSQIKIDSGAF